MVHKGPGKSHRKGISVMQLMRMFPDDEGISVMQLMRMFPDDESALRWFEAMRWSGGRYCPRCGHTHTTEASHKTMPYWCGLCRKYFSVKTGTCMQASNLGYQKWAFAIYMMSTSLKGVSSMKLHRDLGITQKTAWLMSQKIRQGWMDDSGKLNGRRLNRARRYRYTCARWGCSA